MLKDFIKKIIKSQSENEETQRKEFILNVLLLSVLGILVFSFGIYAFTYFFRPFSHSQSAVSFGCLVFLMFLFSFLYFLSRFGKYTISATLFISAFVLFAFYMGWIWGVDVNASILLYALIIVIAGILFNTKTAFGITGLIMMGMIFLNYIQSENIIIINKYWRSEPWRGSDTAMTTLIFLAIAIVSWLSNREINKSLLRARHSEKLLKKERDSLEIKVEERTKELKNAQLQKVSQLYRFAEFGRLSSGLFHDLMNPLNAVYLNLEMARERNINNELTKAGHYLDDALSSAKRMGNFINAVRKQIAKENVKKVFSLRDEINQTISTILCHARERGVEIKFEEGKDAQVLGDEVKWGQVVLNLISNAVDAYSDISFDPFLPNDFSLQPKPNKEIILKLDKDKKQILFTVSDKGSGILPENINKIFNPFFTTKSMKKDKGIGLGLYMVKEIVEKDFGGSICVSSEIGKETIFSVSLPSLK